jgi:tRNA-2-methylthio-N6-dimethylallyladenosine synthase
MNHSDSERIAGFLDSHGLQEASEIKKAQLVIFNTCGVRQMAEDRVYGQIHNIRKQESDNNEQEKRKIIILTGCLANRGDVQKRLKNKVNLFCEIKDFPEKIKKILTCHPGLDPGSSHQYFEMLKRVQHDTCDYLKITPKYSNPHTAYVPIMTGCNNFCAYCVVPYARGREVSRSHKEIIKEIRALVKKGYKEIMLLGQNVNSYHYKEIDFPKILRLVEKIPGKFWIGFMSSHPKDYSDELIETITSSKKICECIHLPLQAGSDKILAKMNRKYTAEHYLKLARKIKAAFKKNKPEELYSLTTDIIVGFPSETKKDFLESAEIMKKVKYDMVFFGQFSPRPGTVAFKMKDNVTKTEKARRENYLNEILKVTNFANNKKYVGKVMEVLVDSKKNDFYFGRTRTMKNVKIHLTPTLSLVGRGGQKTLIGKIVKVEIIKANIWNLEGKMI